MNVNDTTMPAAPPPPGPSPDKGVAPANWLGSQSIFDRKDDRKIGRAMSASVDRARRIGAPRGGRDDGGPR